VTVHPDGTHESSYGLVVLPRLSARNIASSTALCTTNAAARLPTNAAPTTTAAIFLLSLLVVEADSNLYSRNLSLTKDAVVQRASAAEEKETSGHPRQLPKRHRAKPIQSASLPPFTSADTSVCGSPLLRDQSIPSFMMTVGPTPRAT